MGLVLGSKSKHPVHPAKLLLVSVALETLPAGQLRPPVPLFTNVKERKTPPGVAHAPPGAVAFRIKDIWSNLGEVGK